MFVYLHNHRSLKFTRIFPSDDSKLSEQLRLKLRFGSRFACDGSSSWVPAKIAFGMAFFGFF